MIDFYIYLAYSESAKDEDDLQEEEIALRRKSQAMKRASKLLSKEEMAQLGLNDEDVVRGNIFLREYVRDDSANQVISFIKNVI